MPRPVGVTSRLKNNANKNYRAAEDWRAGKKIGRPKQAWIVGMEDVLNGKTGHWEKTK